MSATLLVLNDMHGHAPASRLGMTEHEAMAAARAFSDLLAHGRKQGWVIAHVVRERPGLSAPTPGFQPLCTEPVFLLRDRQALNLTRLHAAAACGVRVLILACFAMNEVGRVILQTGLDLGLSVVLVGESAGGLDTQLSAVVGAGVRVQRAAEIIAGETNPVLWLRDYVEGKWGHGGNGF